MQLIQQDLATIDPIVLDELSAQGLIAEVLRLDKVHPVISGNKWFKLQFYLQEAVQSNKKHILTYGGPWSNHLVATAAACKELGLRCTGVVRGESPKQLTPTLQEAASWGMKIEFISRADYSTQKRKYSSTQSDLYVIPEGGYGKLGVKGAATLFSLTQEKSYTHLLCAVGTGTMLAGLLTMAPKSCQCIGIPVLNGANALEEAIQLQTASDKKNWRLETGFEWGGYAKHPPQLIQFMNSFFKKTNIPTDIVYTGKLFYAFTQLVEKNYFEKNSRILLIHSGGLQGNRSLSASQLDFS
ncbi:MAG: pyridoxal-phosphate dependent enzyme [Chitinophagaceae bacterium]|nr:pyridoxal-phosphate dependent enzyme [Chitinophagaceae bacterium]